MPNVEFMPHQMEAIEKLRNGNILCAGVGTGKSITALGYYYIRACGGVVWEDGNIGPMTDPKDLYIITTARKRDTGEWETECDRFDLKNEPGIHVKIDSWNNVGKYENVAGAFFIFDEQRVIGNGSWARSFQKIASVNEWILLSATPGDTWMDYIQVFIANGFYKSKNRFMERHAVYNRYSMYPKVDRWLEVGYLEMLRRRITVSMKYDKETVPHWKDIYTDYDKKAYDIIAKERKNPWTGEKVDDASNACYLFRKVVNSNEVRARDIFWTIMSKHPRVIIFYNYDYELELMKETFDSMIGFGNLLEEDKCFLYSEWNGHKHEPIPKSEKWAYLVQYTAGCEGWNCVETDTIIFYSQSYSYKVMTQAAGRIDRMNTPFVDLYYYVYKTHAHIDTAISRALKNKKKFNEKNFLPNWVSG